jgi:hypothetical protein
MEQPKLFIYYHFQMILCSASRLELSKIDPPGGPGRCCGVRGGRGGGACACGGPVPGLSAHNDQSNRSKVKVIPNGIVRHVALSTQMK